VNRSLILVTHRTTLLDLVDRIIVVDDGRIVLDGPRQKVLAALRG
jgi:ATP-binding cassette subfamily C protein LapB